MNAAAALVHRLSARDLTVAVAESLTGGMLLSTLIDIPGASACVRGGVVAYATEVKSTLLGVDGGLLERVGAVHPEVARQMAERIRLVVPGPGGATDLGIATTGVAGPDPQDGQPPGTVFVAIATANGSAAVRLELRGTRTQIRQQTVAEAVAFAARAL